MSGFFFWMDITDFLPSLPCRDSSPDGQLQRDVLGQILKIRDVRLLPLLQQPDLVPLPRQFRSLLGEERGRAAARLAHQAADLAPLDARQAAGF